MKRREFLTGSALARPSSPVPASHARSARSLRPLGADDSRPTAGGLTSGIDLALRVVERYFGRPAAERTARYMEYQSRGWIA
ncbi:MAG: hypothetical protein LC796_14745 [Acidobacteria bacterium]|nr:hypothetical protein [Acidobacteriota bacterium]MCA1609543.1 hypothetical protein [Acidobacteriota bacterium]